MSLCAKFRFECERHGHPLGQKIHEADRWIAATAIAGDLDLVSDDRPFGWPRDSRCSQRTRADNSSSVFVGFDTEITRHLPSS